MDEGAPDVVGRLRLARPAEAASLSELAFRSKASWGYEGAFMEACRAELTVDPAAITRGDVVVLEADHGIAGFYGLAHWNSGLELSHFFVDPDAMGRGAGRTLWADAVRRARIRGVQHLLIQSDPNAEGFYLKLGAERIGDVPSRSWPGRSLPLLLFVLTGDGGRSAAAP